VVSVVDWLLGRRHGTGLSGADTLAYGTAQIIGGIDTQPAHVTETDTR
jgi:hypothetical protein